MSVRFAAWLVVLSFILLFAFAGFLWRQIWQFVLVKDRGNPSVTEPSGRI